MGLKALKPAPGEGRRVALGVLLSFLLHPVDVLLKKNGGYEKGNARHSDVRRVRTIEQQLALRPSSPLWNVTNVNCPTVANAASLHRQSTGIASRSRREVDEVVPFLKI